MGFLRMRKPKHIPANDPLLSKMDEARTGPVLSPAEELDPDRSFSYTPIEPLDRLRVALKLLPENDWCELARQLRPPVRLINKSDVISWLKKWASRHDDGSSSRG